MTNNQTTRTEPPMENTAQEGGFLTIDDAAKFLGFSKSKIYKLTMTGGIPHYKPCNKLLFDATELSQWVRQSRVATTEEINETTMNLFKKHNR